MVRKRIVVEHLVRRDQDSGEFNRAFWRKAGPEGRFSASWEMVAEAELFRGKNAGESRLQRSVQHVQRRAG